MNQVEQDQIKSLIRSIPDFPEAGVVFRDITTALKDAEGLRIIMDDFVERYKDKHIDYVLGADARGFIFGAALAYAIGAGFVPARKPGKLPAEALGAHVYELAFMIELADLGGRDILKEYDVYSQLKY
ncbi:MAG: purine phosphoribosyltransferase family protein [Raoultella planticola]